MRQVLRPVALAFAVVLGGALTYLFAFTLVGEIGEWLVLGAVAALLARSWRARSDGRRQP